MRHNAQYKRLRVVNACSSAGALIHDSCRKNRIFQAWVWGLKINIYLGIFPELLCSLGSFHPVVPFVTMGTRTAMRMSSQLGYFMFPHQKKRNTLGLLLPCATYMMNCWPHLMWKGWGSETWIYPKAHGMEKTRLVNQDLMSTPWLSVRNNHKTQWNYAGLKHLTERKILGGWYARNTALKFFLFLLFQCNM